MMLQAGREAPQASTQALKLVMHKLDSFLHSWVFSGTLKTSLSNNRECPPLLHSLPPNTGPCREMHCVQLVFPPSRLASMAVWKINKGLWSALTNADIFPTVNWHPPLYLKFKSLPSMQNLHLVAKEMSHTAHQVMSLYQWYCIP